MSSHLIIIFGVSGCGKTTIAKRVASELGYDFIEADNFHSEENIKHMTSGKALTDDMRAPWMAAICCHLEKIFHAQKNCVLAHSSLRRAHRQQFRDLKAETRFFHLDGDYTLIADRLSNRQGHYMPASLLASQFSSFENYDIENDVSTLDIRQTEDQLCELILTNVLKNDKNHLEIELDD